MKKTLIMMLFFVSFIIVQLSPAAAWSVPTHYEIVEQTYYALPVNVQSKLSLDAMKDGADDPDMKFLDYQFHSYPANQVKVDYWLNRGNKDYKNGNYQDASYSFGIASHYISDGACGPHCENNASHYYHSVYEVKAALLTPQINKQSNEDIDSIEKINDSDGKESWESWLTNKNDFYIQNDLDRAGNACYIAIWKCVS
jgi:hypothetical protein